MKYSCPYVNLRLWYNRWSVFPTSFSQQQLYSPSFPYPAIFLHASPLLPSHYMGHVGLLAAPRTCQSPSASGHLHLLFLYLEHPFPRYYPVPSPNSNLYSHIPFSARSSLTTRFKSPSLTLALFPPHRTHDIRFTCFICLSVVCLLLDMMQTSREERFFLLCSLLYHQLSDEYHQCWAHKSTGKKKQHWIN